MLEDLVVEVSSHGPIISMTSTVGTITIESSEITGLQDDQGMDFVAWYFMPIAMKLNRRLVIMGPGSLDTVKNAEFMSAIWETWLPGHFHKIDVRFDSENDLIRPASASDNGDLAFYSGGIDSTFSLLRRKAAGKQQDVLTVHGMDYKVKDHEKFDAMIEKTDAFAKTVAKKRITLKSDAYQIYDSVYCNPKGSHVTHIFSLAGAAFLHGNYSRYLISSDYRLDQQFLVFPWGSNSATNRYFSDGRRHLLTLDDEFSRSDKLERIIALPEALSSVTFCVNYKARPENCGQCSKCVRTKIMFLTRIGYVPDVFLDNAVPDDWLDLMDLTTGKDRAFLADILSSAEVFQTAGRIPNFEQAVQAFHTDASADKRTDKRSNDGQVYRFLHRAYRKIF